MSKGPVIIVQKARKPWQCDLCGNPIRIGTAYARLNRIGRPRTVWHLPDCLNPQPTELPEG